MKRIEDEVGRRRPERGKDDRFINLSSQWEREREKEGEKERRRKQGREEIKREQRRRENRCCDNRSE